MNVKELLDKTDRLYMAEEMTRRYGEDLEQGEAYTVEALDHMLGFEQENSPDNLIVCAQYREWFPDVDSPAYMDTTLYKKEELLSDNGMGHGYAYDMILWPQILGTEVAQTSIERYGVEECALAIYHEMTFFGCWMDQWKSNIRELGEIIVVDDSEECSRKQQAYPVEDLWEGMDAREPELSFTEEEQRIQILKENREILMGILRQERERLLR